MVRARLLAVIATLFLTGSRSEGLQSAANAVIAGDFAVEPPTLISLGFEWGIRGDDNHNATVAVEYRKSGESAWRSGLPMLRVGEEKVWRAREFLEYWTPRMFAGSILDLEPGTAYQCRFTLSDPDGVSGQAVREASVTTREEPRAYEGGRRLHVYPPDYSGPREEPSFSGLKEAYYGPGTGDWSVVWERPVQPGDVILVHAGLYRADRSNYVTPYGVPFDGTYVLTKDGTPDKPIVIRAAGDGEVIFDGDGCHRLFDVSAADYNYFEGITFRNADIVFFAGFKDTLGSSGLTVRNCRMEEVGMGVVTQYAGSKNFYIADNVILGRDDQHRLIGWNTYGKYKPTPVKSYYGVKVYGQGHAICHNYIAYFHDGIGVCTHGTPSGAGDKAVSIDIYNNDIFMMIDDFIEADGGAHNIRVMRNRGLNATHSGLSAQPVFGGPAYFYRNIVYNVPMGGAVKNGNANPAGVFVYHNTFVAENSITSGNSNMHYRNNLILGVDHPERPVLATLTYTSYTSLDYDGYRPNRSGKPQFLWNAPEAGKLRDYTLVPAGYRPFATLADFSRATGQETHGRVVDYDVFRKVRSPDPGRPHAVYALGDTDFRLAPGGAAVDAGCRLSNVNDDFTGRAPDLGALESDRPAPVYGPRK